MVEYLTCNEDVVGSIPSGSSNNGAVAEWHEGDELQPHTDWFDPSPRLKCRDNEDDVQIH